jgi:serine/threonine protein kinase
MSKIGVVHHDLKPENIIIKWRINLKGAGVYSRVPYVKIVDYGGMYMPRDYKDLDYMTSTEKDYPNKATTLTFAPPEYWREPHSANVYIYYKIALHNQLECALQNPSSWDVFAFGRMFVETMMYTLEARRKALVKQLYRPAIRIFNANNLFKKWSILFTNIAQTRDSTTLVKDTLSLATNLMSIMSALKISDQVAARFYYFVKLCVHEFPDSRGTPEELMKHPMWKHFVHRDWRVFDEFGKNAKIDGDEATKLTTKEKLYHGLKNAMFDNKNRETLNSHVPVD